MNPLGKKLRIASGIVILVNVLILFLPYTRPIVENYTQKSCTELAYLNLHVNPCGPFETGTTGVRLLWAICFVVVPAILSIVIGVFSIIKGDKQKISSLAPISVAMIYIVAPIILNAVPSDAKFSWEIAMVLHIVCSVTSMILGIIGVAIKSDPVLEEIAIAPAIPGVEELKWEQIQARYNIVETPSTQKQDAPEESMKTLQEAQKGSGPRGVLLGLSGMYAGAEIPFADGECIKLGRGSTNDLIFEGQEKISRNHCYIKWNAKEQVFYICDYSSNGIFVNGSEDCIPQNLEIAIEPGTILAIGDEQNTFRLE